jgi:hypothetical protein
VSVQGVKRLDEEALWVVELVDVIMNLCAIFISKRILSYLFCYFPMCLNIKEYLEETVEITGVWCIDVISAEVSSIMASRTRDDCQLVSLVSLAKIPKIYINNAIEKAPSEK